MKVESTPKYLRIFHNIEHIQEGASLWDYGGITRSGNIIDFKNYEPGSDLYPNKMYIFFLKYFLPFFEKIRHLTLFL